MKIRLTESQYKRLLKEDDSSFLDGDVDFTNIGNKVTPFIAKMFMILKNKGFIPVNDNYQRLKSPIESPNFRKIAEEIRIISGYENDEVILLTHNYITTLSSDIENTNEWKPLVGLPLEYYGKMNHPYSVNWSGYLSGWGDGNVSAYATDYEDFQRKIDDGDVEIEYENGEIEYDDGDIQWERNYDYDYDNLDSLEFDLNSIYFNG